MGGHQNVQNSTILSSLVGGVTMHSELSLYQTSVIIE